MARQSHREATEEVDGRRLRSQRSRERILAALTEALSKPGVDASPERIAAEAGVSISTVFRHFKDIDGLNRAMRQSVASRVLPHLTADGFTGTTKARVAQLVERRIAVYEIISPLRQLAMRQARSSGGDDGVQARFLAAMSAQTRGALGAELDRDDDAVEAVIDTLLSFGTWGHLRTVRRLSPRQARTHLEEAILLVLRRAARPLPSRRQRR